MKRIVLVRILGKLQLKFRMIFLKVSCLCTPVIIVEMSYRCTFEVPGFKHCGMLQSSDDTRDWHVHEARESGTIGPSFDHTTGEDVGKHTAHQ